MADVIVWEDDPGSQLGSIQVPTPDLSQPLLPLRIINPDQQPAAKLYDKGTPEFRYWDAAAALSRAAVYWGALIPDGTSWQPGPPLPVILDGGEDLNAFYDRRALNFFHGRGADGNVVFSGESPDVVCHELGHGVLDALRPELFNAMSLEIPAFHESFADMSAILTALQVSRVRDAVLRETGGHIDHSSDLSRLAEQLGAAIRAQAPDAVDPDCLRNAANSFFYQDPENLPSSAPAATMAQEPHSFSRVFTGAFLEALAGMLLTVSPNPASADLLNVSNSMGRLLVTAVQSAPAVPEFYSQVAAALVQADAQGGGRFGVPLKSAFVRRGILSPHTATTIGSLGQAVIAAPAMAAAIPARPRVNELPLQAIDAAQYGLGTTPLFVHVPTQPRSVTALAAGPGGGTVSPPSSDRAARIFVEHLMRLGRVDFGSHAGPSTIVHPRARKTHMVERLDGGALVLRRRLFYCWV
jgi:hypothetical protein